MTDEGPRGTVRLAPPALPRGEISQADVAAVSLALLDEPRSVRRTLEVVSGDTPIVDAVRGATSE